MSTKATTPTKETTVARVPRKGKMSGTIMEWCVLWTLKPGVSGQKIIDGILAGLSRRPGGIRQSYKDIGVHDARYVLFDNETRLLITISFDNSFDKYFDDALALFTGGDPNAIGFEWVEGVKEFPEGGYHSKTWEEIKNFLVTTQVEAKIFANTDDGSVAEIEKALRLQKAFQQVLDNPEAAQALKHPALKPLLEQAAD
jgi:hypothetical protein